MQAGLRERRLARGLTLQELAAIIGTDHTHLSKVERGMSGVSLELLEKYLYACGYEVAVVRVGSDASLDALSEEDRALVMQLAALLPKLPDAIREHLEDSLRTWRARYGGGEL